MAVAEGIEARMFDALIAAAQSISGPPNWRTAPTVHTGDFPTTPVDASAAPQVFLNHASTVPLGSLNAAAPAGLSRYGWQTTFAFYIVATAGRAVWNVKRDLVVALHAAKGTFTAAFGQPFWIADFNTRDDLRTAGSSAATLLVTIDYDTDDSSA